MSLNSHMVTYIFLTQANVIQCLCSVLRVCSEFPSVSKFDLQGTPHVLASSDNGTHLQNIMVPD
jgi:hypothetical protein